MSERPLITRIEVVQFEYDLQDVGREPTIAIPIYRPGNTHRMQAGAIRIHTSVGLTGEYVGGNATEYAGLPMFAPSLLGRSALDREEIYNDAKQALRQQAGMGIGVVDIALWDLAGKFCEAPIYELLGGSRRRLPCYASTFVGDHESGGLDSPEAYADFAEACLDMGYPGFKIHGWQDAPIQRQIETVHAVGRRVGGKMDLMLDPFCAIRTFGDALKLGWACDEEGFFWLEDPYRDGGVSAHAHRKLRQLIKTPLLQLEHVRGLESHVDFIEAQATDFVRGDPDYDNGVTGVMKIAHAAEGFGLDMELHGPGPVRRHLMAAIRNTNYYEMGLLHPRVGPFYPPVYKDGYRDAIDRDGCVEVPDGPGLGVEYDWDFIIRQRSGCAEYAYQIDDVASADPLLERPVGRGLHHQAEGMLQEAPYLHQEPGALRAVRHPVVDRQRCGHRLGDRHLAVADHRPLGDGAHRQDGRLRRVNDGREAGDVEHAQIADAESAAGVLLRV